MRLINADKLFNDMYDMCNTKAQFVMDFGEIVHVIDVLEQITNTPTIDAVEVVRCKDCKHRYMDGDVTHYYWCRLNDRPVDDTDYCAWGECKGGEDE